jgi:hypothetical protein
MRIVIGKDGTARAVYSDQLRKLGLGPMKVTRASNVEFNEASQMWEAITPKGELIASGPDRDQVIKDEVKVIESRL